jgi:hypothetical protein
MRDLVQTYIYVYNLMFVGNDMKKAQVPEKSVLSSWFSLFTSNDTSDDKNEDDGDEEEDEEEEEEEEERPVAEATPKRGRGRPRLTPKPTPTQESDDQPKRGRGRPRKNVEDGPTPVKKKEAPTPKAKEEADDKVVTETPVGEGRTRRGTRVTDLRSKLDTSVEESPTGERKSSRKKTVFTCDECKETFQMEYLLLVHKKRCKRESLLTSPPKPARKMPAKTKPPPKKVEVAGPSGPAVTPKVVEIKPQETQGEEEKKNDDADLSKIDISTVVVSGASTIVITESVTGDLQGNEGTVESASIRLVEIRENNKEQEGEMEEMKDMKVEEGGESQATQTEGEMKEEVEEREEEEMDEEAVEDDGGEWKPSQPDMSPPAKRRRGRGPSRRALAMIADDDDDYKGSKRKRKILLNMRQAIQVLKLTPKRKVHPDLGMAEVNRVAEKSDVFLQIDEDSQEGEQRATEQEAEEGVTNGDNQQENQSTESIAEDENQVTGEEENQNNEEPVEGREEKPPLKVVVESIPSDDEQDISEADYLDVAEIEKMVDLSSSECAICGMHFKVCYCYTVVFGHSRCLMAMFDVII